MAVLILLGLLLFFCESVKTRVAAGLFASPSMTISVVCSEVMLQKCMELGDSKSRKGRWCVVHCAYKGIFADLLRTLSGYSASQL